MVCAELKSISFAISYRDQNLAHEVTVFTEKQQEIYKKLKLREDFM